MSILDRNAPELEIPLVMSRAWRAGSQNDPRYDTAGLTDPRSTDRTCI